MVTLVRSKLPHLLVLLPPPVLLLSCYNRPPATVPFCVMGSSVWVGRNMSYELVSAGT